MQPPPHLYSKDYMVTVVMALELYISAWLDAKTEIAEAPMNCSG